MNMLHQITLLLILPLLLLDQGAAKSDNPTTYEDQEAYEVYAAILQSDWLLRHAHAKTLIIQTETKSFQMCLQPDEEWKEKVGPAISDYVRLNAKPWLLQRRINIEVPYQLIKVDVLMSLVKNAGWEAFHQQYEHSKGWMELSAVGFNNDKTVAVVYMGHHCGNLCGDGRFYVLEKKAGQWLPLDWKGTSCAWAS